MSQHRHTYLFLLWCTFISFFLSFHSLFPFITFLLSFCLFFPSVWSFLPFVLSFFLPFPSSCPWLFCFFPSFSSFLFWFFPLVISCVFSFSPFFLLFFLFVLSSFLSSLVYVINKQPNPGPSSIGKERTLWQQMLDRPNFWVEGSLGLRPIPEAARPEKWGLGERASGYKH